MSDTYDDRFPRILNRLDSCERTLASIQSLLHHAIGPCDHCNGSGAVYEDFESDSTTPCEDCKGTGKLPLDIVDMMIKLKKEAKHQIETEADIPF